MSQLHNRLTDEQVKVLLQGYCQGTMKRTEVQEMLGIGKSRFFVLLKEYRQNPENFSIAYERSTPARLSAEVEAEIEKALLEEKTITEDPICQSPDISTHPLEVPCICNVSRFI